LATFHELDLPNTAGSDSARYSGLNWLTASTSLLLVIVIAIIYRPALGHIPHSDQSNFVLDTMQCDGFFELVSHTYSFTRTRMNAGGDTQLFRPVLFAWLSGLQAFLGLHWEWCQALSIALHAATCVLLFLLLQHIFRRVGPAHFGDMRSPVTYLPSALVIFFALNYALMEQVIWYHIQGYQVALVLILGSLLALLRATEMPAGLERVGWLATAWLLGLIAAFTYELGQFFAVCAGLYLLVLPWATLRARATAAAAFLGIFVIYQGANALDRCQHAGQFDDDVSVLSLVETAGDRATLKNATRYFLYTTVQPFLPVRISLHAHGKIVINEAFWDATADAPPAVIFAFGYDRWQMEPQIAPGPLSHRSMAVLGWTVFTLWFGLALLGTVLLWRRRAWRALALVGLLLGIGLAQAAMIVLGRLNMRPGAITLAYNSHYTYFGLLFALIVSGVALARVHCLQGQTIRRWLNAGVGLLVLGLLTLSAASAVRVQYQNERMAELWKPTWKWLVPLRNFIAAHKDESDFRFAVAWNGADSMPRFAHFPVPYLFAARHIDAEHPKYVLRYEGGRFVEMPAEEWREQHSGEETLCANLVRQGPVHHVLYRDGLFYAVHVHALWRFFTSANPEVDPAFARDEDLETLLAWIRTTTN
jgi:hypothetical protein